MFSNDRKFYVSGIFASGYSEINSSYCFVNIDKTTLRGPFLLLLEFCTKKKNLLILLNQRNLQNCIKKLNARGYMGVMYNGKLYYPGVAEDDGKYMQFKTLHSKCYVKRPFVAKGDNFVMGGDLKITVAGVPKKGAVSLKNNIDNFHTYAKFPGTESGKLQHSHIFVDEIYTDRKGNLTGDSIDLSPCDYIINDARIPRDIDLFNEEIEVIDYEQTEIWDLL